MSFVKDIKEWLNEREEKKAKKKEAYEELKREVVAENRAELKEAIKQEVIKEEISKLKGETAFKRGMTNIANEFKGYAKNMDMEKWKATNLGGNSINFDKGVRQNVGNLQRTPVNASKEEIQRNADGFPDINKFLKDKRRF